MRETVPVPGRYAGLHRRFEFAHFAYAARTHDIRTLDPGATLHISIRGSLVITCGGHRYVLRRGRALYLPSRANPHVLTETGTESLIVHLGPSVAYPAAMADHTARAWSLNLIRELLEREQGWEVIAEGLVLQGLGWLSRLHHLATERPDWLDEAIDLARRQLPLGVIAARVGRHPSHLAREFRRHEGVTAGEFARRCRLELAANSLRANDESIASVALAAGFCDQSHFTNIFRRVFGVTPAEYRRGARSQRAATENDGIVRDIVDS